MTIANAALLTVNIGGGGAWTVDPAGDINYSGDAVENTFLAGSEINLNGLLNVTGDARTDAVLNFGSTGIVNILTAGEPLRLSGGNLTDNPNTIAGGTINGPGILGADTGSALVGFGTINANIDFDGTANLRADGGTLTVTSAILDANVVGVNNVPGVLNVTNIWNTNVTASVELLGGRIEGAAINNDGAGGINGFGEVAAAVRNNTSVNTEGGTLRVTNAASDWDGSLAPVRSMPMRATWNWSITPHSRSLAR